MKNLSKFCIAWLILYHATFCQSSQAEGKPDLETVNLIILNSSIESSKRPFPPVAAMLAQALSDNQLVICTKHLWHTLQEINKSVLLFDQPIIKIGQEHRKLFGDFQHLTSLIQGNSQNFSTQFYEFIKTLKNNPYWNLFSQDLAYHAAYEIIKATPYICKEINEDYILFIPEKLLEKSLAREILTIAQKKHFAKNDFFLGINFSRLPAYEYLNEENITQKTPRAVTSLSSTLNQIALKPLLWKEYADRINMIIPKMNVFVMAHGSVKPIQIAEMSELSFESFLKELNQSYEVKSLTVISCFAGGVIKKTIESFKNEHYFESIPYPILLGAGLFTTFQNKAERINIETKDSIVNSIYTINNRSFYGIEKKYNSLGLFTQFFKYLNTQEHYSIQKKPYRLNIDSSHFSSEYEYITPRPEYVKAAELFSDNTAHRLNNIFLIRFPNTKTWTLLTNHNRAVKQITSIDSATQEIAIAEDVQDIYLKTSYIAAPVIIKGDLRNMSIIPTLSNPKNLEQIDYYFEELRIIHNYTIEDLSFAIFKEKAIRNLAQTFAIGIKKLTLADTVYSDVLFLIKGNTGARFIPEKSTMLWNRKIFCTYKDQTKNDFGIVWDIYGMHGELFIKNSDEASAQELKEMRLLLPKIKKSTQETSIVNLENLKSYLDTTTIQHVQKEQEIRKEKAEQEKKDQALKAKESSSKTKNDFSPANRSLLTHALELASLLT